MRHDLHITGHRYALRPVSRADARFIVELRSDPELSRFLHPTSPRIEDQEAWLDDYFERPGDYYFVIDDTATAAAVGLIGIYDVDDSSKSAEWGRWIVRRGAPAAVESALLVYRLGFQQLGLDELYCRTLAENAAVVSFHDSSGARRTGVLKDHAELNGTLHDSVEHRVDRPLWAQMEPRLDALARRLAGA